MCYWSKSSSLCTCMHMYMYMHLHVYALSEPSCTHACEYIARQGSCTSKASQFNQATFDHFHVAHLHFEREHYQTGGPYSFPPSPSLSHHNLVTPHQPQPLTYQCIVTTDSVYWGTCYAQKCVGLGEVTLLSAIYVSPVNR